MKFQSVDEALNFAIAREEEAAGFYDELGAKMNNPHTKQLFEVFAAEERAHKRRLLNIKEDKSMIPAEKTVQTLNLADYTVEVDVSEDTSYQDALIIAMKKEKAAFKLYSDLADAASDPSMRAIFQMLAQEEARHKLRFEIEYDDRILTEN